MRRPPTGPGATRACPSWRHHAGGGAASLPAQAALPSVCVTETGYATSETSIAATNTGALFFSPAHTENSLARSVDSGGSWQLTYPPKMQYTSLWNTVDPKVTVDRRTGRVFWLRATGDLRTAPVLVDESPFGSQAATAIAYAHGFQVYGSPDDGHTWTTADYQHENTGDWEKIFVGPPAGDGAKPSGYPDVVYVCANAPFEVSGPGRDCYKSLDGGVTFTLAGYVFPSASSPSDFCPALAGNTGVVDSAGRTYQPQSCRERDIRRGERGRREQLLLAAGDRRAAQQPALRLRSARDRRRGQPVRHVGRQRWGGARDLPRSRQDMVEAAAGVGTRGAPDRPASPRREAAGREHG